MPSVHFNQHQALLRALDSNQNQKADELQVSQELKARIDTDHNGELSQAELQSAMQADLVEIQGTQLVAGHPKDIQIQGLETLKNVNTLLDKTLSAPHVWAPRVGDGIEVAGELIGALAGVEDKRSYAERRADEDRRLNASSRAYLLAVVSMRSSLNSVVSMTQNATDSRSKSLNQQAKAALSGSAAWTAGSLVGGLIFGSASAENIAIQAAYDRAKVTMINMREQTKNLPDLAGKLKQVDEQISRSFADLNQIRSLQSGANQRSTQLQQQAVQAEAKVGARAKSYGLTGLVVGAVGGATAAFFMSGKNLERTVVGGVMGATAAGGLGALVGAGVDKHYRGQAESLRAQAQQVKSFDADQAQKKLDQESQQLYQQGLKAASVHDLDAASVVQNEIQASQTRVAQVSASTQDLLKIYQPAKK